MISRAPRNAIFSWVSWKKTSKKHLLWPNFHAGGDERCQSFVWTRSCRLRLGGSHFLVGKRFDWMGKRSWSHTQKRCWKAWFFGIGHPNKKCLKQVSRMRIDQTGVIKFPQSHDTVWPTEKQQGETDCRCVCFFPLWYTPTCQWKFYHGQLEIIDLDSMVHRLEGRKLSSKQGVSAILFLWRGVVGLPPTRKLNPKNDGVWKRNFLSTMGICGVHVNFWGCKQS